MSTKWPKIKLGEILIERRDGPSQDDLSLGRIKIVGKIGFDNGLIKFRSDSETKTGMILAYPGDFLISGINALKGAIAIYSEENDQPVAATIHYSAYEVRKEKADITFLWWFLRSKAFRETLMEALPGGIKTELKSRRLLPLKIPLPPLAEQKRIVAKIAQIAAKIAEARSLHDHSAEEAGALLRATLHYISNRFQVGGKLSDVLKGPPRNGWSAQCDNDENGTPVLALGAVTGFRYRPTEFKRTSLPASKAGHFWLKPGDLLITRSNSPELVGHAAIYDGKPSPCIYPDLMMRLELRENDADRRFVWYWLQAPLVREFIRQHAKGTSPTMKKIAQDTVMAIPFPSSLPVFEQRRIVAELDAMQTEVEALKRLQAETAVELDALFPSILDKVFKGEL